MKEEMEMGLWKRILIMEEDGQLRSLYQSLLGEEFAIVTVANRLEAARVFSLAKARSVPFDLVLVNLKSRLEPEAGFQAVLDLLEIDGMARVVLHSSVACHYSDSALQSRGFIGGIQKTMRRDDLIAAIRSFL